MTFEDCECENFNVTPNLNLSSKIQCESTSNAERRQEKKKHTKHQQRNHDKCKHFPHGDDNCLQKHFFDVGYSVRDDVV